MLSRACTTFGNLIILVTALTIPISRAMARPAALAAPADDPGTDPHPAGLSQCGVIGLPAPPIATRTPSAKLKSLTSPIPVTSTIPGPSPPMAPRLEFR